MIAKLAVLLQPTIPLAVTVAVPFKTAVVLLGVTVIVLVVVVKLGAFQPVGKTQV